MSLACRLPDPDQRDITRFGLCQDWDDWGGFTVTLSRRVASSPRRKTKFKGFESVITRDLYKGIYPCN